jgi:hypothetical protein
MICTIRSFEAGAKNSERFPSWPGFVPAIHVLLAEEPLRTWMPGTGPGMTSLGTQSILLGFLSGFKDVDGRDEPGHDGGTEILPPHPK